MRQLKFLEKVLIVFLTVVFITTFFFSSIFAYKPVDVDPRYFFVGLLLFTINVGSFFYSLKILRRHYDHRNHKGVRKYYYSVITLSMVPTLAYLRFYDQWPYMAVYFFIVALYAYLINKEFGRLSIKIKKDHDGDLYAGDITTFNGDIKVRGKNKKIKGSMERLAIGDVITISRDSETVLTLNVIKNVKKP